MSIDKKELYKFKKELKEVFKATYLDGYMDGFDSICPEGSKISAEADALWKASSSKDIVPVVLRLLKKIVEDKTT